MAIKNDVLNTLLVANGIYIAGTTVQDFNSKAADVYDDFSAYYTLQNNVSQAELDTILAAAYSNGEVDLKNLFDHGIPQAIPGFAEDLLSNDKAAVEPNSLIPGINVFTFEYSGQSRWIPYAELPWPENWFTNSSYSTSIVVGWWVYEPGTRSGVPSDTEFSIYRLDTTRTDLNEPPYDLNVIYSASIQKSTYHATVGSEIFYKLIPGGVQSQGGGGTGILTENTSVFLNSAHEYLIGGQTPGTAVIASTKEAVVSTQLMQNIQDGIAVEALDGVTGTVKAFVPTDAILADGYDSSILNSTDSVTGHILTIENFLPALQLYDQNIPRPDMSAYPSFANVNAACATEAEVQALIQEVISERSAQ